MNHDPHKPNGNGNPAVAVRLLNPMIPRLWYVSRVPGDGGVDWKYTTDSQKALMLSPYWQRRFLADMRHLGDRTGHLQHQ